MNLPTTITVDEVPPMGADSVIHIGAEVVRFPFDGKGVEVWDGKKYVRRHARVVHGEGNVFLLEVCPPNKRLQWTLRRVVAWLKNRFVGSRH